MMKVLIGAFAFWFTSSVLASTISREYKFSPAEIESFEKKVLRAQGMRTQVPADAPIALEISDEVGIWCDAGTPRSDGSGCMAVFHLACGQIQITIEKEIPGFGFAASVKQKLSGLDPASTTEHVQFGSPFKAEQGDGTHYFCAPHEGQWDCTLMVSQKI